MRVSYPSQATTLPSTRSVLSIVALLLTQFLPSVESFWNTGRFHCRVCSLYRPASSIYNNLFARQSRDQWPELARNDNQSYWTTNWMAPIDKSDGILYKQSIFSKMEYDLIRSEISPLMTCLNVETTSSVACNRMGASLSPESETVRILRRGKLNQLVNKMTGADMELSIHVPVEIRTYEKKGAGMEWHVDDILYDPPQVEAVITLENDSDCITMWKEASGRILYRETDPNSVLLLRAGGPSHCVTPLKRGKRVIIKCAFAVKSATFLEGIHRDQFGSAKKVEKKRRRKH